MSLFKRSLLAVGFSGFGVLILCALLPFSVGVTLAAFCAAAGIACLFSRKSRPAAVCLLAMCLAAGSFLLNEAVFYRPLQRFDGKTVSLCGTVIDTDGIKHGVLTTTVRVERGELPTGTKLLLRVPYNDLPPVYGDEIIASVAVENLSDTTAQPTLFDGRKADRIVLSGWVEDDRDFSLLKKDDRSFPKTVSCFRTAVSDALLTGMTKDVRPLLCAMCLGDKSSLSKEVLLHFRRSGVSHLLVVSGLHVSIVAMGVYGLLRKLRLRRKTASWAALATLLLFVLLVGFHPSVIRACVLNALVLCGNLFRRRADGLNSLGGGLLFLWLVDPYCVYDVGLWMSFGATIGLLWLSPRLTRVTDIWFSRRRWSGPCQPLRLVVNSLCVTLSATLPILPICVLVFGEISLVAPLTNLLAVFAATLLLWCAAVALLLSVLHLGFFAGAFRLCATLLARYLLWITDLLGGFNGAVVFTDTLAKQLFCLAAFVVLLVSFKLFGKKGVLHAAVVCCVAACVFVAVLPMTEKGKTHITVKRAYGDNAALILQEDCSVLLVDGGNGWTAASSLLETHHLEKVDNVIITDSNRKLTRKWNEFNDAISVGQYFVAGESGKCFSVLSENHITADELSVISLKDSGRVAFENGRITLSVSEKTVAFCKTKADGLSSAIPATYTVYADETEDVSFVIS